MDDAEQPTRRRLLGILGGLAGLLILARLPPQLPEGCGGPSCLADFADGLIADDPNRQ